MTEEEKKLLNQFRGACNKANGKQFEDMIEQSNLLYEEKGVACIEKTPEPVKYLQPLGNGRFVACYGKKAQPDFKGTLSGGKAVCFECKHTERDRIAFEEVNEWQFEALNKHFEMGALCFVLVSFGFREFYRVPWGVWTNMKSIFGHKYVTPGEIEQYRISFSGLVLDYLNNIQPTKTK